ncbi:hypothetical protein [Peribacillus kribbensis]|uniref:hypothetical protein n=1 Tax=Peribacillus kribbensis TaxID=356658 RepID=UPI000429A7B2|nr:hypothetical protein [Peribacillus kribbensis]
MRNLDYKELLLVPANIGLLRFHIYGFERPGYPGEVCLCYKGYSITVKGENKKWTLTLSLLTLNQILSKK